MRTTKSEQILFCDCDDTLILHDVEKYKNNAMVTITDPYCGTVRTVAVHEPHVQLIRERAKRGAHIKAMSAGGYQWAAAVVKALDLEDCIAECISKPVAIIDDLPIEGALGKTMYLDPNSKWKSKDFIIHGDKNGN